MPARLRHALALILTAVSALLLAASAAGAAGTPDLQATISSQRVLHGEAVPVAITTTNPAGQPYGYNLSFRVVLPPGVSYSGGAETVPTQIAGPNAGETTLIFRNVSDISPNATHRLAFEVAYDQARYDVGDSFPIRAQAFANDNPRWVPLFDAAGQPIAGPTSWTGSAGPLTGTTTINAIEVEKDEPSPEGEILRGVHDHQTVYTVMVRNNGVRPTSGVRLVDYVPAGLEFLGCGGATADNTTNTTTNPGSAEEYPGAGDIDVPVLTPCTAPQTVETVNVDPDGAGPMPQAVYTRVVWPVGTLAVGERREFRYRAAIPIRENTTTWNGAAPATTGAQATNLDNNRGPETRDEQLLRNYAVADGSYDDRVDVADETTLDRTAEDWRIRKSGSTDDLVQGGLTTWTLILDSSEYRSVRDATITDTLPNGLCPLDTTNRTSGNDPEDGEDCRPAAGQLPSAPYKTADENADGTWTLTWDKTVLPELAHVGVSRTVTVRFPTRTHTHYQANFSPIPGRPILTRDSVENRVRTEATAVVRCTPNGTPDCSTPGPKIDRDGDYGDGTTLTDVSSAGQLAARPSIDKKVAASGADCAAATYVETIPTYHPGDRVCWKLRVDFPTGIDTSPQAIRDFLPPGATYESGSDAPFGANNVNAAIDASGAPSGVLAWSITGGGTVPRDSRVFERTFSTRVEPPRAVDGEILGNLMKFSSTNTAGVSEPLRDQVDIRLVTPVVGLVKGVHRIERGGAQVGPLNGANVDGRVVEASDRVTYRIDVTNSGGQDAEFVEVWDVLPREYDCNVPGSITAISHSGACIEGGASLDRIVWTLPAVAVGAPVTLNYTALVPADIGPARTLVNTAGVRGFVGITNTGGRYPYVPVNNIDPAQEASANAPAARDPSNVRTNDAAVAKTRTTSVDQAADGNVASQATIGETVTYTLRATVPEGTTLAGNAVLTDAIDSAARQPYVAGTAVATLDGAAAPAGFVVTESAPGPPSLRFPADFAAPAGGGDRVVVLRFDVVVADVAGNTRGGRLSNTATLTWTDPDHSATPRTRTTPRVETTIVEPFLAQAKRDDTGGARVTPGDVVRYAVTTTNAGANVSTAHEVLIVDTVPVGLTPVDGAGVRLADSATVDGAVWNEAARTLSKSVATIAPGASAGFTYSARVDDPAIGGAELTNTVVARTASLPSSAGGRRDSGSMTRAGYEASAQDTIRIRGASVGKSVTPGRLTVGEVATYELLVTIPADISLYDVTVRDVLPDALAFVGYGAVDCVGPCPFPIPTGNRYDPVVNGDGTTTIGWDFGDVVTPLDDPLVMRIVYTARVRDRHANGGANVVRGESAVNSVIVGSNRSDRVTGPFDPARTVPTTFEEETDPPARATVTVIEPRVRIDKAVKVGGGAFTDGPATAQSDDALEYRLTVTNSGDAPAYDVEVRDTPDAALTDVTPDDGAALVTKPWSAADREISWTIPGPIAPNGSVTLTYRARLVAAAQLHDGQAIDNTAAVPRYFGVREDERDDDPSVPYREYRDGGSDSTRVVLDFPTLTLVKTTGLPGDPDSGSAEVGRPFPWRIVVRNTSATATAHDVVVTDALPGNWSYDAGSATLDGVASAPDPSGGRLAWTVPALAPGQAATIAFTATPAAAAADGNGLDPDAHVNRALVSSARDEAGNPGNGDGEYRTPEDTASATLRVPRLTIAKTPDAGTIVAGASGSFTIVVRNDGLVDATNVTVTDLLPGGLAYVADSAVATPRPAGWSETVDSGPGAGETTIAWRFGRLGAGESVSIALPVRAAADVPSGTPLVNRAAVRSQQTPREETDSGRLDAQTRADMAIVKDGPERYVAGTEYTWNLRVTNNGPSVARDVVVSDPLPAGVRFVSADSPCALVGGAVRCELGTFAVGETRTLAVRVAVDADRTGALENTAGVETSTDDPNPANDESSDSATPDPLADVTIEKRATPEAIARGHQATFTLTVRNLGPSVARDVAVTDALPSGLAFVSVDDSRCTETGGSVSCALGDLAVGAPVAIGVTVRAVRDGAWRNVARVTTTTPQPQDHEPDEDDATLAVGPASDLGVVKSGPATVAAGGRIVYDLVVTNHGEDPATGVTVTDALPQGVTFDSASPGCSPAGATVTCAIGALAVGESVTRQIAVIAPVALASTTLVNTAAVDGDQIDENPANDSDDASTQVGPSSDLGIVKSGPATAAAGGRIAWTLLVTNHGPSAASGVHVQDALPPGVTFVSASPAQGTCSAGGQLVDCAVGALASGASTQIQVVGAVAPSLENATVVNVATVRGEQPDHNPSNDRSQTPTRIGPPSAGDFDLALSKTVQGGSPVLGGRFAYALTVTNSGPATATDVTVTDTLPRTLRGLSASVPGGGCALRGALVTCRLGSLRAGETRTVTVKVRALAAGRAVRNSASVRSREADRDPSNDRASATVRIGAPSAKLTIAKTALRRRAPIGGVVRFRITVRNSSRSAAADVVVCDRVPAGLSLVKTGGGRLRRGDLCWTVGLLPGKGSRTFGVAMRVHRDASPGTIRNVARVTAANARTRETSAGVRVVARRGGVLPGFGRGGGVTG